MRKSKINANKIYKEVSIPLTAGELKARVIGFQNGNQEDAERIRNALLGLVFNAVHNTKAAKVLGEEDALNEAWLIVFTLIKKYKGEEYELIPAMLKKYLEPNLYKRLKNTGKRFDHEVMVEQDATLEDEKTSNELDEFITNTALQEAYAQLADLEKVILEMHFFQKMTYKQIALALFWNERSVRRYKDRALKKLHDALIDC